MDKTTSYEHSRFNPTFEPYPRDGQILWSAHWCGYRGVGITQREAQQQLRQVMIAAGELLPWERDGVHHHDHHDF